MPSNVVWFERLSYLALAIGFFISIPDFRGMVTNDPDAGGESIALTIVAVTMAALLLAANILLIWLVARRRKNWARWLLCGLSILLTAWTIFDVVSAGDFFRNGIVFAGLDTFSTLLDFVAFYLIFTGNVRPWFRRINFADQF